MFIVLSWRNVWRNPRRTIVIMTAVVIGVWCMIFLGALMRGIANQMVRNGISTLTGHIQVHQRGYRNDPVIENSIRHPDEVERALTAVCPPGSLWTPRVRVNAVASNARHSRGVTLVGIDPHREAPVSFIGTAVTDGNYLDPGDRRGVIIGKALAEKYETKLGWKLLVMSQDEEGEIASKAFRITGIFRAELESTETQYLFVTLPAAQEMLSMKDGISEFSIVLPDHDTVDEVTAGLRSALSAEQYAVHDWRELLPIVTEYLKIYDNFIYLWFLVVFIAMGFGIVNTTLMAVFERIREFGLLRSLGMKPLWIVREVLIESFFILFVGMVLGNLLGFLSIFIVSTTGIDLSSLAAGMEYAGMSRIIYPSIDIRDVLAANLFVLLLGLLVSLYPAIKAARFTPVEALSHT